MSFAYLQLYSRYATFGGVSEVEVLAERLAALAEAEGSPVSAALTDTFSLAAFPLWRRLLAEAGLTALAGTEVGVSWGGLPYALLLLAESEAGYANLCQLLSAGLQGAGAASLTANLTFDMLNRHREGLIAIAPWGGGPVTAALHERKASDAKSRAVALQTLFGSNNFFIAAPPLTAQGQPQTIEGDNSDRNVKLYAGLVKLARELKIGLVGTAETRYAQPTEARLYAAMRSRMSRALSEQYSPGVLQAKSVAQDWLYSLYPGRPQADLYLHSPAELQAHYNESDWPGALANNARIAQRCAAWQPATPDYLAQLRQDCEMVLSQKYPDDPAARSIFETELEDIAELGLALPLLAAARLREKAVPEQVLIGRRLGGSLVAELLGLTAQPYVPEGDSRGFVFEAYTGGRPLRLEVGRTGRARLLDSLNRDEIEAAPVAVPAEAGSTPSLHPRQLIISLAGRLKEKIVLLPARAADSLEIGAMTGPVLPDGCARLEIYESSGVGRLQQALDLLNDGRRKAGDAPLTAAELPTPAVGEYETQTGAFERALVIKQLEWLKLYHPAAYYAAAMTLAAFEPTKLTGLAELVRQSGLRLLPPDINLSAVDFTLESSAGEQTEAIRTGLACLLPPEQAGQMVAARQSGDFGNLDDFVKRVGLDAAQIERLAWVGALDAFGERERMAAGAEQIAATGQAWQEWHSRAAVQSETAPNAAPVETTSGQLSLFDLFDAPAPADMSPPEEPPRLDLAEVAPVSRLEKLRQAYQALGFVTAEHPLWSLLSPGGAEVSRDDPLPLSRFANLNEVGSETQPSIVAGLVTALRRLPIAGSAEGGGEELTVLQLEDFSGRAEVLNLRTTSAEGVELVEGAALIVRVRPLKLSKAAARPVLVALAIAPYPPQPGMLLAPAAEELPEAALSAALETGSAEPPPASSSTTPDDQGWADSLFAGLGVPAAAPAKNTGSGQSGKAAPKVPRLTRLVHIRLPRTESPETDLDLMERLNNLLRQHPGEDGLILYLPQPDGSTIRLEPQSLRVNFGEIFKTELINLVGPAGVELEERPF